MVFPCVALLSLIRPDGNVYCNHTVSHMVCRPHSVATQHCYTRSECSAYFSRRGQQYHCTDEARFYSHPSIELVTSSLCTGVMAQASTRLEAF